jgi:hypothetical protein
MNTTTIHTTAPNLDPRNHTAVVVERARTRLAACEHIDHVRVRALMQRRDLKFNRGTVSFSRHLMQDVNTSTYAFATH